MDCKDILSELEKFEEIEKLSRDPHRVSQYQAFLAVGLWKAGEEIIEAEKAYNKQWDLTRQDVQSDTQAEKRASTTEEWMRLRKAKNLYKCLEETIKSLKKMLALAENEAHTQY